MAEFISILSEIKQLPPELHLLCPRQNDADNDTYEHAEGDDEGSQDEDRSRRISEAEGRRKRFVSSLQLLAYDGHESEDWQKYIWHLLGKNLGRCEICIREYYVAKLAFLQELREDYEDEDIRKFFEIIDRQDIHRITSGLSAATASLRNLPETKRKIGYLKQDQLFAIFEALICDAFLDNPALLDEYFEEPFRLIQTKKALIIREFLPAVTKFLFSAELNYSGWAKDIWRKIDRCPSDQEWSWIMKDTIQHHMANTKSITVLWSALGIIVERLSTEQVAHKLYDIQPSVGMTALEHLNKSTPALPLILNTLKLLLRKAPAGLWQQLGSISSSTVAEQIFGSPQFDKALQESVIAGCEHDISRAPELSWITAIIASLQAANRPHACRTIVTQLSERIRSKSLSIGAKGACYEAMMKVLKQTIVSFSDNEKTRDSVTRLVLSDTLNIISGNMDLILEPQASQISNARKEIVRAEALDVVRNALALECQCLKLDFENLSDEKKTGAPSPEVSSYSPAIWDTVVRNLWPGDVKLASAAVLGVMALPGLEKFRASKYEALSKAKIAYNITFEKLTGMLSAILGRLSDFEPSDLDELYKTQNTCMSLIAALFSADNSTYQASVDLVKRVSGQSGRQEALSHLLNAYLGVTVYSICWTFRRLHKMETFASIPRLLKSGMEVLDVLCNTQTGILRTQKLIDRDFSAVQSHWSYQWAALNTVFEKTEDWSKQIHDKEVMADMCRDAMQYADALFDQYDVLASALTSAKPARASEIPGILLDGTDGKSPSSSATVGSPARSFKAASKWLRLRDEYLADTSVKLLTKMLYRLARQEGVHIDLKAIQYVRSVATSNAVKTNLTAPQKGDLARAVEAFTKEPIVPVQRIKQSKIQSWVKQATSDWASPSTSTSRAQSEDDFGDSDIADRDLVELSTKQAKSFGFTTSIREKQKSQLGQYSIKPKPIVPSQLKKERDAKAFIEQRRRETEARKVRDREAAAKLRGAIGVGEQTKGQGSALRGIGVQGKDHTTGIDSMMVSSESESDSDSSTDELDKQLFGSKARLALPAVRAAAKVQTGPVKKIKLQRSQKDIRARLAPDLSDLHKTILGWDFFADTDLPPSSEDRNYALVTDTFRTPEEYQRTFEPLLILESWQSFRTAREDGSFKPFELKVSNQVLVDNFVELNTTMSTADGKAIGIGPSDVVLLSKANKPSECSDQPHCLARVKQISYKKGEMEIIYRVNSAGNPLRPHLNQGSKIWGTHVLSLTPLEREYGALMALPYYDLCEEIVRAKPSPLLEYSLSQLSRIIDVYNINPAQAKAVKSALENDGFTLIQGPPGSGKSSTICALVGAMMTGTLTAGTRANDSNSSRPMQTTLPPAAKKILVCAPSNAAVDELVMRFKAGVKMINGETAQLSVVRLGRSDAINSGVKDVTLEELVNAQLNTAAPKEPIEDIYKVMMEHKETSEKLNQMFSHFAETRGRGQPVKPADEKDLDGLKRKRTALSERIDKLRERQNTASRDAELNRKRMQQMILDSAHILCATLSGSGHDIFQTLNVEFDTVIIDEAAQSIELSALIPLKYGCSKCILVGDPKQLPPTVLSREAAKFQYEQSLFARMEKNHQRDVHLLDTQYRMHPEISLFPSKTFYESRLKDGPGMAQLRARPWHYSKILAPYRFFDVQGMSSTATKGHSLVNSAEVNVAMQLYDRLVTDVSKVNFIGKIGIITPYKGQLRELKARFVARHGEDILSAIEFNTTDAFQGRECEIIIFSCVRASTKGIGFLNDIRRMNVGLTRAMCSLWVLGNSQALSQGEFWRALISDAESRNLYTDGDIPGLLSRPLLTADMMKDDVEMTGVDDWAGGRALRTLDAIVGPTISPGQSPSSSTSTDRSSTSNKPDSTASVEAVLQTSTTAARTPPKLPQPIVPKTVPRLSQTFVSTEGDDHRYGPSGGRFGLNGNASCNICGSFNHFSHACDNADARAASLGSCQRCRVPGHSFGSCPEPRCLECGEIGHGSSACTVPTALRLSLDAKAIVRQQETEYGKARDRVRERRAEKQLSEHAAKIPAIKTTPALGINIQNDAKRKREEQAPLDAPRGPKALRSSENPSPPLDGGSSAYGHKLAAKPAAVATGRPGQGGLPPRPMVQAPLIKRKKVKEDDLFMKRR